MLEKLIDLLGGRVIKAYLDRRRVRVLVHRAVFLNDREECFFITVTNLSRDRDLEITHIWFSSEPQVHVINADRTLPKRLRPDETWETWIPVSQLPADFQAQPYTLVRVRLSTGSIAKSRQNKTVPPVGAVPGGPIRHR